MTLPVLLQAPSLELARDRALDALSGLGAIGMQALIALFVLGIGWLVGRLVALALRQVLRWSDFDRAWGRLAHGGRESAGPSPTTTAAALAHWGVLLLSAVVAGDALGFELSASLGTSLRDVLPRVLLATMELVIGIAFAMLLGRLTRRLFADAGARGARWRGQAVTALLTGFTVLIALEQLGFAAQAILLFGVTIFGAIGLALALAVGLGCRDLARDFVVEYLRSLDEGPEQRR